MYARRFRRSAHGRPPALHPASPAGTRPTDKDRRVEALEAKLVEKDNVIAENGTFDLAPRRDEGDVLYLDANVVGELCFGSAFGPEMDMSLSRWVT